MLLLARSEAGEPIPTEPIALTRLLDEAAFEHQKRFSDRSVIVRVKPKGMIAEGQPEYLRQVLQNLVGNAEKYSPGAEPINLQARFGHEGVVISVSTEDLAWRQPNPRSSFSPSTAQLELQPELVARASASQYASFSCRLTLDASGLNLDEAVVPFSPSLYPWPWRR
jgi:hypothetical protein